MNSIESNFVPYQVALDMKSIGFDEECFWWYDFQKQLRKDIHGFNTNSKYFMEGSGCSAPLYQQAFSFFREKYNFDIGIAKDSHDIYHFQIDTNNYGNWILPIFSRKYEEAELKCLVKLIEIVKQNNNGNN